ncbi:MAG: DegV family protein [Dehalococcoidales bacterium]|nr:DegV family protein [Dehalococcoidales bacterium]
MSTVGIITDTIACLPGEKIKQYNIGIVPVALNINGKPYLDQVDITPADFWKIFPTMKELTTGAPPIGIYLEVFEKASKSTNNIVCTFVSKNLSAIFETAVQAKELFKKDYPNVNIEIIDSKTAAGAQAFIVLEMAKAAEAGKSLAEVAKVGEEMTHRVKFFCAMDTLKYLIKSGRAPKTAYMGELFQIKPIIGMVDESGIVQNIGRARGKRAAMKKLVDLIKDYADINKPLHVFVHFTDNIEDGEILKKMVTDQYKCAELYMTDYTPVMSGHTGPVFTVAFYS